MGIVGRWITASLAAAGVLLAGGIARGQFGQAQPDGVVHHFKQARALTLDPTRVAVLVEGPAGAERGFLLDADVSRAMADAGLDAQRARAWAIDGWWLAPVDATARNANGVHRAVDRLAAQVNAGAPGAQRLAFVSPVFVDDLGGPMFVTPQILVGFAEGTGDADARRVLADLGAGAVTERDWAGMRGAYRVAPATPNGSRLLDIANALAMRPEVAWAEPDMAFTGRGDLTPNDPGYPNCWGLNNTGQFGGTIDMDIDAPEAWNTTTGDPSIITLIIDTGVDPVHADINQVTGIDTTSQTGTGEPINQFDNHGTAVAGCVSAIINNGIGTVGVAPSTKVSSARTFISINADGDWTSIASWTVNSLAFGAAIGARVSNNSNHYGFSSNAIETEYITTRGGGMVHFAAAGNDSNGTSSYPAILSSVNSIAALDIDGGKASFSNFGPSIAFAAPGVSIYSTDRTGADGYVNGSYAYVSGTSFASPYSAGVAALILSQRPSLTASEVEQVLRLSAVDLGDPGRDNIYGDGFVNAANAMTVLAGPPGAFDLQLPLDNAPSAPVDVQLDWSPSLLADSYHVVVDDDSAFASPEVEVMLDGSTTLYNVPDGMLSYATTYHWGVTAINTAGQTLSSPATFSFTSAPPPIPEPFNLTAPLNGATNVPTGPTFTWATAQGANSYRVIVSTSVLLVNPVVDQMVAAPTTTLQLGDGTLAADTTHFWRVDAMNDAGTKVSTPSIASFTTAAPPPGCPGDLNGDGDTNVLDFSVFALSFGQTGLVPGTGADLDADGDVDVYDFSIFVLAFGCTSP